MYAASGRAPGIDIYIYIYRYIVVFFRFPVSGVKEQSYTLLVIPHGDPEKVNIGAALDFALPLESVLAIL